MGAKLVGAAFLFAARVPLKPNEARLLLFMALTALDSDNPPRYFAARESSALALGRIVPDAPDQSDPDYDEIEADRAAAFQRVKIATQGLVRAGAITRMKRGREGNRAEFAITLAPKSGTENVPLDSTENVPLSGSESVPAGVRHTYPQGTTDEYQEQDTGITARPSRVLRAPVDNPNGEQHD